MHPRPELLDRRRRSVLAPLGGGQGGDGLPIDRKTSAARVDGLPAIMDFDDAASVPTFARTTSGTVTAPHGCRGGTLGERATDESPSAHLFSDHSTEVDGRSARVAIAMAATIADCSVVSVGALGAPVTCAMETSMLLPVVIAAEDNCSGRATMIFLGASSKGSRRKPALRGAWK